MKKKDLFVVTLATFCLTATLFMTLPIRSNPFSTALPNQWADLNDDGTVDILDAITLANNYGETVDKIKSVKPAVWQWNPGTLNLSYLSTWTCINSTLGYKQLTIILTSSGLPTFTLESLVIDENSNIVSSQYLDFFNITTTTQKRIYNITGTAIRVTIWNGYPNQCQVRLYMQMDALPDIVPVNVTNWSSTVNPKDSIFTWFSDIQYIAPSPGGGSHYSWQSGNLNTRGFKQVTIDVHVNTTCYIVVNQRARTDSVPYAEVSLELDTREVAFGLQKTYDVKGTEFYIQLYNLGDSIAEAYCFVYMTSIPSLQSEPSYDEQTSPVNASQGMFITNNFVCNGYSRLSISATPDGRARNGSYEVTLYVYGILWGSSTWESLPSSAVNVTFFVINGTVSPGWLKPFVIETKSSYCTLYWAILDSHNLPPDWWVTFNVYAYLRSE